MNQYKKKKRQLDKLIPFMIIPLLLLIVVWVGYTAMGGEKSKKQPDREVTAGKEQQQEGKDTDAEEKEDGAHAIPSDKSMQAVVKGIRTSDSMLQLLDIESGKDIDLLYNGATYVYDRFGTAMVMGQLQLGEIVKVDYDSKSRKMQTVKVDENAWEYQHVYSIENDPVAKDIRTGDSRYQYNDELVIVNGNQLTDMDSLNEKDILTLKGVGTTVWSIIVTTGHGTLTFQNYEDFIGGSLEIGYDVFQQVDEGNMEFQLREGSYKLVMQRGTLAVNKFITVARDDTTVIDLNEYRNEVEKTSLVTFRLKPSDAELYIDDNWTDAAEPVHLGYGDYVVRVELEGYETCSRLLTVDESAMTIQIDLVNNGNNTDDGSLSELPEDSGDETEDGSQSGDEGDAGEDTDSGDTGDGESESIPSGVDEDRLIYVQKPVGASVYFDGKYYGEAPVQFEKSYGEHTIVLKRSGYATKSYMVEILNDGDDAYFSFGDMTKE